MTINESTTKIPLRYDPSLGDKATVNSAFLRDKKKLPPEVKRNLRRLIRAWKSSKGALAIFEPKRKIKLTKNKVPILLNMYVIEVQKREPPTHIVVLVTETDPFYKKSEKSKANPIGSLFVFDRIFTDYNEYLNYINHTINNKTNLIK